MTLRERLYRFRLRSRSSWTMLLPTVGLSGLLLVVVSIAVWQLDRLQESSAQTVAINVSAMKAAEELEIAIREVRNRLHLFLITRDRAPLAELPQIRRDLEQWLAEARKVATTKIEQEQIRRVEHDYKRLSPEFDRLTAQANSAATEDADLIEACKKLALDEMHAMLDSAHEYLDFNEHVITENSERNQVFTDRLVPILFVLGLCGSAAGIFLGFAFARNLRRRVIECNIPIRDLAGKLNEVLGPLTVTGALDLDDLEPTLRQIADRVQHVVRRLQDSERETLRSEQLAAVGQLAAGMAHELRNPLTSMKALVQSSLMGDEPLLEGRDLEILEEEIDRMTQLIAAFLDYARPPQLEKRPLDLVETCQQAASLILPRANQKGVRFTLRLLEPPLLIDADTRQLRQVLLNLFDNSLDATPEGGCVWIELQRLNSPPPPITTAPWVTAMETSCADTAEIPIFPTATLTGCDRRLDCRLGGPISAATSDTNRVQGPNSADSVNDHRGSAAGIHLLVADSGCGIPPELGDRIFEPFVSTKETGLGLGLSICRRIVQSHGGKIVGTNLRGGGTAFSIWLPLPDETDSEARPISFQNQPTDQLSEFLPAISVAAR